jgi:hypothetical protein
MAGGSAKRHRYFLAPRHGNLKRYNCSSEGLGLEKFCKSVWRAGQFDTTSNRGILESKNLFNVSISIWVRIIFRFGDKGDMENAFGFVSKARGGAR